VTTHQPTRSFVGIGLLTDRPTVRLSVRGEGVWWEDRRGDGGGEAFVGMAGDGPILRRCTARPLIRCAPSDLGDPVTRGLGDPVTCETVPIA
jgi:hypothetical protein